MTTERKRHIAVIPPHEFRNKNFIEDFRRVILPRWQIIPRTMFYKVSYARLLSVARTGASYDVVIASRMRDLTQPGTNNVASAAAELRRRLQQNTIFILSMNDLLATVQGLDLAAEKAVIAELTRAENDPTSPRIGGIIRTSSTDPAFLISILADVLDDPNNYLHIKSPYSIESQAHFLNHPPGHTQVGIGI
ncbi:MAG TPA: hypothetical protein VM658_10275 [bacterium]|nr:hypothetical protein [bacterium]